MKTQSKSQFVWPNSLILWHLTPTTGNVAFKAFKWLFFLGVGVNSWKYLPLSLKIHFDFAVKCHWFTYLKFLSYCIVAVIKTHTVSLHRCRRVLWFFVWAITYLFPFPGCLRSERWWSGCIKICIEAKSATLIQMNVNPEVLTDQTSTSGLFVS